MLGLPVSTEMSAKANALRWCRHVLKAKKDNRLKIALNFRVRGRKGKEHIKRKEKDNLQKACLKEKSAFNRNKWKKMCLDIYKPGNFGHFH